MWSLAETKGAAADKRAALLGVTVPEKNDQISQLGLADPGPAHKTTS